MTSTVRSVSDVAPPVANRTNGHTDPASHAAPLATRVTAEISLPQAALASGGPKLSPRARELGLA